MMKRYDSNRGFSLIELLTVIAIIAILAAIIFPVMSSVKERARQNQCMTNLHQIAIGVQMFKQDNRRYPEVLGSKVKYTGGQPEMFENVKDAYLFAEYVKTIKGFHCPSAPTMNSKDVVQYNYTASDGSCGADIEVYAYDSYDGAVSGMGEKTDDYAVYRELDNNAERHYYINWAPSIPDIASSSLEPYPPNSTTDTLTIQTQDYARQLRFRNPPADTVVTWCSYHEGLNKNGKSLVVFLDGSASTIPAGEMARCKWRVRPKKS